MDKTICNDIVKSIKKVNHFTVRIDNITFIYNISDNGVSFENTWKTDLHFHNFYEMHFMLCGKVEVRTDFGKFTLCERDVLIIKPGAAHQTTTLSETVGHACIPFDVVCNDFPDYGLYHSFVSDLPGVCLLHNSDLYTKYITASSSLICHDVFGISRSQAFLQLLTADLLEQTIHLHTETDNSNHVYNYNNNCSDYRRQLLDNIISEYYMENWTIEKMAEYMLLSPKQASRIAIKITGLSFAENILRQRMLIAKKLLENNYIVTAVAETTGYNSYNGFLKAYKKYYGILPSSSKVL